VGDHKKGQAIKQDDAIIEHTSTICKINKKIDKPKHCRSDFIHNHRRTCYNEDVDLECSTGG
jgi:hypothetical protein